MEGFLVIVGWILCGLVNVYLLGRYADHFSRGGFERAIMMIFGSVATIFWILALGTRRVMELGEESRED